MNIALAIRAALPALVSFCVARRTLVLVAALLLGLGSIGAAALRLGVTTDTQKLFADTLPWKQADRALNAAFPQNDGLLVAVVDGAIPEQAEAAAAGLAQALRRQPALFGAVSQPDMVDYFQRNAFLLIGNDDLRDLLDRTIDAQPFLGQLIADPSLRGLFAALALVAEGDARGLHAMGLAPALAQFHTALRASAAGSPRPLSWETLLGGKLAAQAGRFRFVLAHPTLDFGMLEPGGTASDALRAAAAALPEVRAGQARVRLTGEVALDDEEFSTVAEGAVVGLVGSFALVVVWLFAAVRSWRLVVPIALTLLLGLLLTTGFAALAVGTLNLISVAFAILFVGIAVDFAIQFTVRFRERRHTHPDILETLRETARQSGSQILVASLATASGFLAFTPTAFVGVAQLGVIAGGGMLIAFVCTLTVLPPLLGSFKPRREKREVGVQVLRDLEPLVRPLHWPIIGVFAALAVTGAAMTPFLRFDGDPLHTKNQHMEAVMTLHDLMDEPLTNPYTIDAVLPSRAAADAAAAQIAKLPLVNTVLTLDSFLPEDQPAKLAIIADAAAILAPTLAPPPPAPPPAAPLLRAAARKLSAQLDSLLPQLAADDPLRPIAGDLALLAQASDATLISADRELLRYLPQQVARLRQALAAGPVTLADVPADLRRQWLLPDGRARLQVLPDPTMQKGKAIRRLVDSVGAIVPQEAGSAVWIVRSAQTIIGAFSVAAASAVVAIAFILALALRKLLDVMLVMTPLVVSALITVVLLMALGISLNFANIIALPLLLGVGVSFNIYFVMNFRAGVTRFLGSATSRAVLFSALTTGTAFGSLALSGHPGTASMGVLLLLSLASTVVTTLFFLPALLAVAPRPRVLLGGV